MCITQIINIKMWKIKVILILVLNLVLSKRTYTNTEQIIETITTNLIPFIKELNNSFKNIHRDDEYNTVIPTVDSIKMERRMIKNDDNYESIQMFLLNVEKAIENFILNDSFVEQQSTQHLDEKEEFNNNESATSTSDLFVMNKKKIDDQNNFENDSFIECVTTKECNFTIINDMNLLVLKSTNKMYPITTPSTTIAAITTRKKNDLELTTIPYLEFTNYDQMNYTIDTIQEYDFIDIDEYLNSTLIVNFMRMHPTQLWRLHGVFTVDYLKLINPHWLKYPPADEFVHYILAFLYALICCIGMSGNCLVIFMFIRCRSLRTPANTLIINLAISDFLMMSKTPIFIYNSLYFGPALGSIGCEIYGYIGGLTGTVSIVTLTAISIDRYLVIVYPMDPNKRFTGFKSKLCVITTWAYGFLFSTLPLLNIGVGNYVPEGLLTSCSFDYLSSDPVVKIFILIFFCAAWVLPFCVICFCYIRILSVVIEAQKLTRTGQAGSISSRHCKDDEKKRTEIKLAGVVVVVILLWFLAWTPYAIVALLGISGYQNLITPITSMVPALFCKVASCIDPFIYAVTHPRFRSEIRNMLGRGSKHRRRGTNRQQSQQYSISISSESGLAEKALPPPPPPVPPLQVPQEIRNDSLHSNHSGNIEEIVVMVNLPNKYSQTFSNSGHSTAINTSSAECLKNAPKPPSWYVKPSFASRSTSSSIRSLRGRLSVRRDPASS